jgi:hypothetical protein
MMRAVHIDKRNLSDFNGVDSVAARLRRTNVLLSHADHSHLRWTLGALVRDRCADVPQRLSGRHLPAALFTTGLYLVLTLLPLVLLVFWLLRVRFTKATALGRVLGESTT